MTLTRSVARQCRLLRAPPALPGALQRRSFASSELADEPVQHGASAGGRQHDAVFRSSRRVDLTAYRKHQRLQAGLERRRENGQRHKRLLELSYFLTPQLQDSDVVPVHSATLIPASATAATPDDFLDKIQPISELAPLSKHNLVVFLATPSFAPWLLDERVFLEKALAKLYASMPALPKPLPNVHAICAVVDRLPEPQPSGAAAAEDFTQRALNPPLAETGYEGVAYFVLPSRAEVSKQPAVQGEFGCLDFLAHTHTYSSGRHYDRLRVPLANTVFQTGQPSTLVKTVWAWSEDQCKLEMRTKRQPKTSVVNLSAEDPKPASSPLIQSHLHREAPALSIPLLPLTVPRQVDGYMGNIIRGVVGANHVKITDSTELEQVVPRFFKSRGEPAQATSAWALVIPKSKVKSVTEETTRLISASLGADPAGLSSEDYQLWQQKGFESLWQSQPPQWNTMIQDALLRGARLHKVLSGGGGWGKKAGLLSLDPVPVGAPAWEAHRKDDTQDDFDSVDEFSTALKPVVEDGDFIQFFTPAVPAQREEDGAFKRLKDAEQTAAQPWSWEFGVIPSTVDSIPGGSWQHTGNAKDMAVFRGCFGALTEGGLTLMRVKSIDRRTGFAEENLFSTTVDVPFSRWSAIRLSPKKGIETGRISDSNKEAKALMEGAPVSTKNAGTS